MRYYVVQILGQKGKRVVRTDIQAKDLQHMYSGFYKCNVLVTKSRLPQRFFETLAFCKNKHTYSNHDLELQFSKWCYMKGKELSKRYAAHAGIYASQYYNTGRFMLGQYLGNAQTLLNKHLQYFNKRARISVESQEDSPQSEEATVTSQTNNNEITAVQPESITLQPTPPSDNVKPPGNTAIKWPHSIEDVLKQVEDFRAKQMHELRKDAGLLPKTDTGYTLPVSTPTETVKASNEDENVFRKRKLQLSPVQYHEWSPKSTQVKDVSVDEMVLLVVFYNVNTNTHDTTVFDDSDISLLRSLEAMGLDEIQVKSVIAFPKTCFVRDLIKHHELNACLAELNTFVAKLYDVHTALHKKPCNGVLIKSVLEFLFTNYDFTLDSTVEFNTLLVDLSEFNNS